MPCKLCGEDRPTVRSHIIPESFYPFDPGRSRRPLVFITPDPIYREGRSPNGEYDASILCEVCESRLSPWDDAAYRLFADAERWTILSQHKHEPIAFTANADYLRIKLFFISLLWRAHVSSRPMFRHVNIGAWERTAKQYILDANPGSRDDFAVFLSRFVDLQHPGPILDPRPERITRRRFVRFYLGNFIASIKVDYRAVISPFDDFCLAPDRPTVAIARTFKGGPEERALLKAATQIALNRSSKFARKMD